MAKLTKAEREQRVLLAQQQQEAAELAMYPDLLMKTLARAKKVDLSLSVQDSMFVVTGADVNDNIITIKLAYQYSPESYQLLDDLENVVDRKERANIEEQRRYAIYVSALSKLNPEERKVLGL